MHTAVFRFLLVSDSREVIVETLRLVDKSQYFQLISQSLKVTK